MCSPCRGFRQRLDCAPQPAGDLGIIVGFNHAYPVAAISADLHPGGCDRTGKPWDLCSRSTALWCATCHKDLLLPWEVTGRRFASEPLDEYSDEQLAAALEERLAAVRRWRQIYRDDFIPFAHGVRRLAVYCDDVDGNTNHARRRK